MQDASPKSEAAELAHLRTVLHAAGDSAYDWDLTSDNVHWLSDLGQALSVGLPPEAATGAGYRGLINPEDLPARQDVLSCHLHGERAYDCEYRMRTADGSHHWVHDQGTVVRSADGTPERLQGVLRQIEDRKNNETRHAFLANYDELTGHYNRSRLRDALEQALYYSQRYHVSGAFLVVGIDDLTMVNDAFGFEIADEVIVAVGRRLSQCVRASDSIGRLSGDRFGMVLSNCPPGEVALVGTKILEAIRDEAVNTEAGAIRATVSIGAMVFPEAAQTASETIARAEIAMQKAKSNGRDCFSLYEESEGQRLSHRANIMTAERVQRALADDRLVFAYQPIVYAEDGETHWYECLIRMIEPDGEIVAAGKFMPVVEKLGLIRLVDRRVTEMAVEVLASHPAAVLAINVSGLTATDPTWLEGFEQLLDGRRNIAERLIIEITETTALDDLEVCSRFVHALRDMGCRVALDDFGAGYTSFRNLKALSIDIVKIDGSFVRGIETAPDNLVFVRTLLGLANSFDLICVAECVERQEEAELLRAEGVHFLQGFAYGVPSTKSPWSEEGAETAPDIASESKYGGLSTLPFAAQ